MGGVGHGYWLSLGVEGERENELTRKYVRFLVNSLFFWGENEGGRADGLAAQLFVADCLTCSKV